MPFSYCALRPCKKSWAKIAQLFALYRLISGHDLHLHDLHPHRQFRVACKAH